MTRRIDISKAKLCHLYDEELSQREIAKIFGCSQKTIWNRMQEYGIRGRTNAEAKIIAHGHKSLRRDFDSDPKKKAYLMGFCKGDARVKLLCEGGQTIRVDCSSTKSEQIELFRGLFSPYGHIRIGNPNKKGCVEVATHLNLTFAFLLNLEDNIPAWILANNEAFFAFLAGYTDAEGNIGIYEGKAVFVLRSYDKNILHQAHAALLTAGIQFPRPRIVRSKGHTDKDGHRLHQDYWSLGTKAKASLLQLFEQIGPYLRHAKRIRDMQAAIKNIEERNVKGWTHVNITETELRYLYEEEELSQEQSAKALGCSPTTVWNKMRKYGIKARSLSEAAIIARSRGKSKA